MYRIAKQFEFSSAHKLYGLPLDHQCGREHGHNWVVEVILAAETLSQVGFIRDYGELNALKIYIDEHIDHRQLNEVMALAEAGPEIMRTTTAEDLARFFYNWCKKRWPETEEVRVSETRKTWASYKEE